MKLIPLVFAIAVVLLSACGQQQARQHQQAVNDMMDKYGDPDAKDADGPLPSANPPSDEIVNSGLMGEWKSVLVTGDTNANGVLDANEKEKGSTNYNDYMKLNADGSCLNTQGKFKASYEVVEKNGNRSIEIIERDGSRTKKGRIISLNADELHLLHFSGGRSIIVYQRP